MNRTQWFKYFAERSSLNQKALESTNGHKKQDAKEPAKSGSRRAGKKALYALEVSEGRPSRKSTRKSANRQKNDAQFSMKRRTGEARPEERYQPIMY